MTSPSISAGRPLRAVYRTRRLLAVLAAVGALTAAAGGATYALGADLVRDAASHPEHSHR
jgi:hypothetical protein